MSQNQIKHLVSISLLCLVNLFQSQAFGQNIVSESEYEGRQRYGLKMGLGVNTISGGKLQNPFPAVGFIAGFYMHNQFEKRSPWGWQYGLDLRLRGGNFDNAKKGDTAISKAYTKMSIMSLDLPLLVTYRLSKQRDVKFKQLQFGLQPGFIFNSIVYVGPDHLPSQRSQYFHAWDKLPLKPLDYQASFGYQVRGETIGYQIGFKYSFRSLNNNFILPNVAPTTDPKLEAPGTPQKIGTMSLEFALVF